MLKVAKTLNNHRFLCVGDHMWVHTLLPHVANNQLLVIQPCHQASTPDPPSSKKN